MPKLSVLITTYNEEDCIAQCLESVWPVADQVVVVDSFSTDNTPALVTESGATLFQREYPGPGKQKNWGIEQCTHPWILSVDADETLDITLVEWLLQWKEMPCEPGHYTIRRINYFKGKRVRFSGWQTDRINRLFSAEKRFTEVNVHEKLADCPRLSPVPGALLHHTFKSELHYRQKIQRYAREQALDYQHKTGRITLYHLWLKPIFRFVKHYVLRGGILDGTIGLDIACYSFLAVRWRYTELLKLRKS